MVVLFVRPLNIVCYDLFGSRVAIGILFALLATMNVNS